MFKWIKNLFKKEEIKVVEPQKNKMDLSQYKMGLNIKAICYFEKITGKSFFGFGEEDIMHLLYACFLINNPETKISFNVFMGIMQNEQIAKWASSQFQDALGIIQQFNKSIEGQKEEKFSMDQTSTMTDFATSLIIDYGMDAKYVMYDMDIWEIEEYFEAVNTRIKREMELERFWTYIKVLPHIDGKKCKSPEALVPFEWEKDAKKKRNEENLKNNEYAIKHTIGRSIFGDKKG
jgi:hypothetical protein